MDRYQIMVVLILALMTSCQSGENEKKIEPVDTAKAVTKTNPMKLYMHYMPWFQSKEVSGYWGSHWKMKNKNPDNVDENGIREIAAHYYPLIGPYDSKDKDVIEYHLLLMKYAGIDGILVDWYGSHHVYDYRENLNGANAVIDLTGSVGLEFAVVYEEFTAGEVEKQTSKTALDAGRADMRYLQEKYFIHNHYSQINNKPLLLTFGPRFFKQGSQWDQIFDVFTKKPTFLPLWDHGSYTGLNDSGEFAWVDFNPSLSHLNSFYGKVLSMDVLMGSAYPRFHDFYEEGGVGSSYGFLEAENGNTLRNTLEKAKERNAKHLQLVTWNDFGEGTVIEPTLEDEFLFLEIIQEFAGVTYNRIELEAIHGYYLKKKKYKGQQQQEDVLKQVFNHFIHLEVSAAMDLLNGLP